MTNTNTLSLSISPISDDKQIMKDELSLAIKKIQEIRDLLHTDTQVSYIEIKIKVTEG